MKIIVLTIFLLGLAFLMLGVKVLFVKGGKFPSGHVHDNKALTKRGIRCAHGDESEATNEDNHQH